ncbi:sensor histidine kinase [Streptomyces sp. NK08204]|uniref:sensor histidine kinase n=1 Tax=Streptomyces sp. NK08204 TaxID=2873260 RepID=UPI001CED0DE5|nr:ATP-binding protein [Streptomyces sp. NK08204]
MSGELPPLAQQLHDGVLQALAIARIRLEKALAEDGPLPRELGADLKLLLDHEIAGLRHLISGSALPAPPQPDLPSALAATAEHLQSATGIRMCVENRTAPPGRWAGNDLVAYRIVREALHNTARHSDARHAWVNVAAWRDRLVCSVYDDGHGFAPATTSPHFGMTAMDAQARKAGGHLAVRSGRTGTFVTLVLPRDPVPEREVPR